MRSEEEMMELILNVAKNDDRIRAVYMNGSRANPNVHKDIYQDYDIVYVVEETKPFVENKEWLSQFGEIAIMQEPDLMDTYRGESFDFSKHYTWLILFKDGNRIDLTVVTKEVARDTFLEDKLTVLLLDKDDFLPNILPPTDEDYYVKEPSKGEFIACCNNFWWCLNNVGKGIARDELPYVMKMYNFYVRNELNYMVDWYIGINTKFSVSPGKMGKFYKKYLPRELYDMYVKTYSDGNYNNIWRSVITACRLFRTIALAVSQQLGFNYNIHEDDAIMSYLNNVKGNKFEIKK